MSSNEINIKHKSFGPISSTAEIYTQLSSLSATIHNNVRNLFSESSLCIDGRISIVFKSIFYQLRQKAKLKSFLSQKDLERVLHVFIISRLDYCNSVYVALA